MSGRGSRGKPPASRPRVAAEAPEDATRPIEMSRELLESMLDESERPTIRLPARPPFAHPDDEALARDANQKNTDTTVRKRVIVGPDGVPRMLDEGELEESTRPYVPSTVLLGRVKGKRKKR